MSTAAEAILWDELGHGAAAEQEGFQDLVYRCVVEHEMGLGHYQNLADGGLYVAEIG